ncbi:hypothetical protein [Streptomyces sp. NBC_00620]|uniref:hypothetical protein n=1 Tax=Streptomyces sp. NBC_00620 TaxID=2903666 RepID=UPI002258939B|nr:hypothetical protein [Streptomyces sp. NBC_00620]MCX4974224.1 hypothetical protein [Streptomyces sp. NBC_00620]
MNKDETEEETSDQGGVQVPWLVVLETVFVLVIVAGLGLWSVPVALVVGGLLGVLACERALADWRAAGVRRGGEAAGGERQ